jgi:hypothetical protein
MATKTEMHPPDQTAGGPPFRATRPHCAGSLGANVASVSEAPPCGRWIGPKVLSVATPLLCVPSRAHLTAVA